MIIANLTPDFAQSSWHLCDRRSNLLEALRSFIKTRRSPITFVLVSQLEFRRFGHYWNSFSLTAISLCIYSHYGYNTNPQVVPFHNYFNTIYNFADFFHVDGFGFNQYEFIGWPTKMHLMGLPVLALFFFLALSPVQVFLAYFRSCRSTLGSNGTCPLYLQFVCIHPNGDYRQHTIQLFLNFWLQEILGVFLSCIDCIPRSVIEPNYAQSTTKEF